MVKKEFKKQTIAICLDQEHIKILKDIASASGVSVSSIVSLILSQSPVIMLNDMKEEDFK